jgi:hypothetical protein
MSDIYGYERGIQYNNDIMSRNTRLQQAIADYRIRNQENTAIAKGIESTAERAESAKEEQKGEEGAGEFLADARNVYKVGGAVRKEISNVNNAVRSYRRANFINEGGGIDPTGEGTGAMRGQIAENREPELRPRGEEPPAIEDAPREPVLPGGESDADINAVLDFGDRLGDRVVAGAGEVASRVASSIPGASELTSAIGRGQTALEGGTQAVRDTAQAVQTADIPGMVEGAGRVVSSAKAGLGALDSIGKTAEGLNVVSGVSDILDDTDGGFKKMNTAEKVGNIAGITSAVASAGSLAGSLESAGAMLDATGIGAEIGLGLNVAGAVAGGISALSDYIGGKEKQKRQLPAPTQLQAPKLQPQAQAPISAQQSGGVALSSYN